ncbi:hypothetical protein IQ245_24665 [Tychonema sp. LEGE 07196]|uniref:hypothetical protein n=1 Tax=Tychonema sp. LEGE 07196 TaxID=1828665 RepID=UPI001A01193F|nr:hypothetical protein [Tychonema sp. LEGE 07196]MBE9134944.1 hypothetical protein [Tychonema sp. LEGE 07196]
MPSNLTTDCPLISFVTRVAPVPVALFPTPDESAQVVTALPLAPAMVLAFSHT